MDIIIDMRYEKTERVIEQGRAKKRARQDARLRALFEFYRETECTVQFRRMSGLNVEERNRAREAVLV